MAKKINFVLNKAKIVTLRDEPIKIPKFPKDYYMQDCFEKGELRMFFMSENLKEELDKIGAKPGDSVKIIKRRDDGRYGWYGWETKMIVRGGEKR